MALTSDSPSVGARELRNQTRAVLDRVADGESVVITLDGRPVARIEPIVTKPRWVDTEKFLARLQPADRGLLDLLAELDADLDDDDLR